MVFIWFLYVFIWVSYDLWFYICKTSKISLAKDPTTFHKLLTWNYNHDHVFAAEINNINFLMAPKSSQSMRGRKCDRVHKIQPWVAGAAGGFPHFFSLVAGQYGRPKMR